MKRIFTLLFAAFTATTIMAQMHGPMKFVGASNMKVSTMSNDNPSDTILFAMNGMESGNITLPAMKGMKTIPSFTISGAKFTLGENHVVTFADQTFSTKVKVDGAEKNITGTSLSGTYNMEDNSLSLTVVFQYGKMPMSMTYSVKGYYVKAVSNPITVTVGGQFTYNNDNVTYELRRYKDGETDKLDVTVPSYTLANTIMGNLTLGSYTVKGLVYDEAQGGYYRDYKNDGLKFHFTAVQGGKTTMDKDYDFATDKDNNILVKYEGNNVSSIVNTFQVGTMPFGIVSVFSGATTSIDDITTTPSHDLNTTPSQQYNLAGQRVDNNYKGIVIVNGKKYLRK
ncbi:calycin-like domain-containing protein [Leyella stercorea]|uniref:calycin-like domain-containing protein n=1 Tax=Leyella stercorea TaxID=363265 RepID=UPI00242FD6B4|nr:calycin-like domain-containing protein [Leyella stercorea]